MKRTLLAQGREAEIFLLEDGTVLKLLREPTWGHRIEREATALRLLAQHGLPAAAVIELVTVEGRPGLVTERLPGDDLMKLLSRNPLAVWRAGRVLARVHAEMHECVAPSELPDLHDELRDRIMAAPPLPDDLRRRALDLLDALPRGDRLVHGDLHVGNLLGTWAAPIVIDWGDAARGDPAADVARTALLHRLGSPPPGAPLVIRALAPVGQGLLAGIYLRSYRKLRAVDPARLADWTTVRAAARLNEPIPEERERLLRVVRRGLARLSIST